MTPTGWVHTLWRRALAAALLSLLTAQANARAQARWTVDPKASLAWWQVVPHMNHLWATTCPEEPSWRPGEGRSAGWLVDPGLERPRHGYAGISDTTIVPLYPRYWALPVCTEAVAGHVVVGDTVRWRGARGHVTVRAAALTTGDGRRDDHTRAAVLQTKRYPEIRFTLDSLVDVTREADTLRGTAVGRFSLHGVTKPMTAVVQAWPDAAGLRVLAKFRVPPPALVHEYGLSRYALGFGVGLWIWRYFFMGVDLLLHPDDAPAGNQPRSR